jgi:ubiquinone/menaquinone biosynthesis C-methylase UbiE
MIVKKMVRKKAKMQMTDYLCCPDCKSGLLACRGGFKYKKCSKQYEVIEGIPILVDLGNLTPYLQFQVRYFEEKTRARAAIFELSPWQKNYVKKFVSNAGAVEDALVIDCGTGSGYMALELAKKGAYVIACDLTLKSLINLKDTSKELGLSDRILLVCCTAESLPIKNGIADYFISNAVLEHLPRDKEAISEMDRVTRSGAMAMIALPFGYRYVNPLLLPINLLHDWSIGHLRRYDEKKVAEDFKGWTIKKTFFTGHTAKAVKALVNMAAKVFDENSIEEEDESKHAVRWGAHNMISFLAKKPKILKKPRRQGY